MARVNLMRFRMSGPSGRRSRSANAHKSLRELSMAVLTASITLSDGRTIPAGSRGAVVLVYENGAAYEVEFSTPFRAVVTVEANQLKEAEPA